MSYLSKENIEDIYPLSPLQQGMLFHTLYDPESAAYLVQFGCAIEGSFNYDLLEKVWNNLIKSYHVFRTVFNWKVADDPVQIVLRNFPIGIDIHDLKGIDSEAQNEKIDNFFLLDRNNKFDLARGPLLRLNIFELSQKKIFFLWTYHHIIIDGWSFGHIMMDFFTTFIALESGQSAPGLQRPPYKNYILWIKNQSWEKDKKFWTEYLLDFDSPTPLPWDHNISNNEFKVNKKSIFFSKEKTEQVQVFAREKRITLSTLIQAAWAMLLGRYCNLDDIVFGATISGRPEELKGADQIIGLFINTLPVRVKLESTVEELLKKLQNDSSIIQSMGHNSLPHVKECSSLPAAENLFNSIVVFENYPVDSNLISAASQIDISDVRSMEQTNFDFTLAIGPGDEMEINLAYAIDRFDEDTISGFLNHFNNILMNTIKNPNAQVSDLDFLDSDEKKKIIYDYNKTSFDYPHESTLASLFEKKAQESGSLKAVVFKDESLTYDELNRLSNNLAHYLRKRGIKPGAIVGMTLKSPIDNVVSIMGILKSGGAYMPIDYDWPENRIEYMLEDSKALIFISDEELVRKIKLPDCAEAFCFDKNSEILKETGDYNPEKNINSRDIAYCIYTSGSTGRPKGSLVPHQGVVNLIYALKKDIYSRYKGALKVGQVAAFSFDVSVQQIFAVLLLGHTLYPIPADIKRDMGELVPYIIQNGIEVIDGTPSLWELLTQSGISNKPDLRLKHIIIGGEPLPVSLIKRFYDGPSGKTVSWTNVYGVTESSVDSTAYHVNLDALANSSYAPIGKPINNTKIYILDNYLNPVPIGASGEICIAGHGLSFGYLNNPERTKENFVQSPFDSNEKIYRTGDLGKFLPDGNIEFIGRIDFQVKISGYRIEPGEIESALLSFSEIKDCVVVDRVDESGTKYLIGYYVSSNEISVSQLRTFLGEKMQGYMIPSRFMRLEALPLNSSGKINRKALPKPESSRPEIVVEYIAPRNEKEELIASIWKKVLGVDKIGIYDSFFEMGGHSIKAMRAIFKINEALDIEIPLKAIFEQPTIDGLIKRISKSGDSIYQRIEPLEKCESYELSNSQQRLWFLDKLVPDSSAYNINGNILLTGKLDIKAIKKSIQEVVNRHESLRVTFTMIGNNPAQIISDKVIFDVPVEDVSNLDIEDDELIRKIDEESSNIFNLETGPLLRVKILQFSSDKIMMLLTMHHIISDGWSMDIFIKEAVASYTAIIKSQKPYIPELKIQYRDYAAWQNRMLADGSFKDQEEYWLKTLCGPLPALDLPTDKIRPPMRTTAGARYGFSLETGLSNKINNFIKEENVTLFMFFIAVFGVFLNKLSNQEDIIIGSPIAGRNNSDLQGLIGFFVNMLSLRIDLSENPNFNNLLKQVKKICLDAYANQDYPFNRLIDILNPARDASRSPIFSVMFALQNAVDGLSELSFGNLKVKDITRDPGIAKFDLSLYAVEGKENFNMYLEYNTDIFNHDTIERYGKYINTILNNVLKTPKRNIFSHDIMSDPERDLILKEFNNTEREYPLDKCVYQIIEEQTKKAPENIAVTFEDKTLTYSALNEKSNQLARYLRKLGVCKEIMVTLMLDRSLEMEIALLGVMKSGGAYVPIGTDYPEARVDYILEDTESPVVLIQKKFAEKFLNKKNSGLKVICLDNDWDSIAGEETSNLSPESGPENLAYVLYTSGSTGMPKGVACIHKGLCNRLVWMQEEYSLEDTDRILQKTPYTFDVSGWEFFWALMYGARVHFLKPDGQKDPQHIIEVVKDEKITTLHFVPSMLSGFLYTIDNNNKLFLNSLKRIICSGEALLAEHRNMFFKYFNCELHNLYGPTEASIDVTSYAIMPDDRSNIIPIGKPIANTKIYILNKQMMPAPIGVMGQIYLAGVQLAREYVKKSEKTAEVFISNSISPDGRLYKTGDLGRWTKDGNIEYLGRVDHQVKIRGNRIELGEVESVLSTFEAIHDCVVVDQDDETGNKFLVAYYTSENEEPVDDLRSFMLRTLPEYMAPSRFVFLKTLPLNQSGKVDRKALPEIESARPDMASVYVAPSNETEEALAAIWKEVLSIEKIGVKDNFFNLGGHSLKATQVISRIKNELNIELPLRSIFEDPTIEGLVNAISNKGGKSSFGAIEPLEKSKSYALSHAQKRLWVLDQIIPDSPAYNIPVSFIINGNIDYDALKRAFNYLVERHESLRTTFESADNGPVQIVAEKLELDIKIEDIPQTSAGKFESIIFEEAKTPFHLSTGPLFRVKLYRITDESLLFIINMHHIISDGWSLKVLVNDLGLAYLSFAEGKTPELTPLRAQYRDYAAWQNNLLNTGELENQKNYWQDKLGETLPVIELPSDRPRPAMHTANGSIYRFDIKKDVALSLKNIAKEKNITTFMFLLGVLKTLLKKLCNEDDIIVGSPIAGRNNSDLEGLIGFFINTLALRTDLSGNPKFFEALNRIKETCLGAYANQDYPFDKLIDLLSVPRDASRTPVFSIMFSMQDSLMDSVDSGSISFKPFECDSGTAKFDMTIFAIDTRDYIALRFEYNTDLFDESTIEKFAGYFLYLLEDIIKDTSKNLSSYSMIEEKELNRILFDFNATEMEYPVDATIVDIFEIQAAKSASSVAVAYKEEYLTYNELDLKSNQLAHCLISKGVAPGTIVGVMLKSPVDTIVAILGILKSGGAYMPIDSDWPENRIKFMLEDGKTSVLVSCESVIKNLHSITNTLCLDRDEETIKGFSDKNPEPAIQAEDIAYCIYTSGSTGRPKGSIIPHRAVVNLVYSLQKEIYSQYEGALRVAQVASFSFDASVQQIFASLLLGHTLYPISGHIKRDMEELIPYIIENKIEIIDGTPSLWELLIDSGISRKENLSLKHIVIGGETLSANLVRRFNEGKRGKEVKWTNVYGITECGVDSTACHVNADIIKRDIVPIGKPLGNTRVYILDKELNPVPIGVPGELYIGGDGLSLGYINNPESAKNSFIVNPFKKDTKDKVYRTGDSGKWLSDGNIEFIGRIDFQVKIHGFRIEPGEIESVFKTHSKIKDCVVLDRLDNNGSKYLVGYYVSDNDIPVSDLRSHIEKDVPFYMIPSRFMRLRSLPLNSSGKVNRSALPEIDESRPEMTGEYVEPRNEIEAMLVEIWKQTLNIKNVGIHDNFFELGGDSIISLQVVNKVKKRGYEIRPRYMFEYQTVAEISHMVEVTSYIVAEQGPVVGSASLTPIQEYFFDLNLKNPNYYNQSVAFSSSILVNEHALRKSLQIVANHHDALRTVFVNSLQEFTKPIDDTPLVVKKISSEKDLHTEVSQLHQLVNIEQGPVFCAGLYIIDNMNYLVFVAHHLVVDGVSWRILIEDIFTAYGYVLSGNGKEIMLPEKTTSYKEWSTQLVEYASKNDLDNEIAYWQELLAPGIPELPVDFNHGENSIISSENATIELSEEDTENLLKKVNSAYNTEINDLLLTAFMKSLKVWTGNDILVFDLEGHGREDIIDDIDIARTVGWFTSIFPVVLNPGNSDDLATHIKYVKEKIHTIPQKGFNYNALKYLKDCNLPHNTGISFNYLGQTASVGNNEIFDIVNFENNINIDANNHRANLLDVVCIVAKDKLRIDFIFSKNKHKRDTIENLAASYKDELLLIIAHCLDPDNFDVTPSDFDLANIDQDDLDSIYD